MTNIEKVKRILDAGHWVKVTYPDGDFITVTSYNEEVFSYINVELLILTSIDKTFSNCTIEVIQRIPTPYKSWDKVLVLSNPEPNNRYIQDMVWKVYEVKENEVCGSYIWDNDKSDSWYIPYSCLSPSFDDEKDTDLNLSWKEVTVTIDGKEYSATLKLI